MTGGQEVSLVLPEGVLVLTRPDGVDAVWSATLDGTPVPAEVAGDLLEAEIARGEAHGPRT